MRKKKSEKRKRKKINEIYKYKCSHPKCEYSYKTKKQLQNHHYKMTQECQLDSIEIIKMIRNSKNLLKNIIENNKNTREKFEKLYLTSKKEYQRNYPKKI